MNAESLKRDFQRLKYFAKALGATVEVQSRSPKCDDLGYYVYDHKKPRIILIKTTRTTQLELVMTLLHEIGHMYHWAIIGRPHHDTVPSELSEDHSNLTKAQRGVILEWERAGINLMPRIWKMLNLSIPKHIMWADVETDLWVYKYFYKHGKYPELKARRAYREKALRKNNADKISKG